MERCEYCGEEASYRCSWNTNGPGKRSSIKPLCEIDARILSQFGMVEDFKVQERL